MGGRVEGWKGGWMVGWMDRWIDSVAFKFYLHCGKFR